MNLLSGIGLWFQDNVSSKLNGRCPNLQTDWLIRVQKKIRTIPQKLGLLGTIAAIVFGGILGFFNALVIDSALLEISLTKFFSFVLFLLKNTKFIELH